MGLQKYRDKRDFDKTPEPRGTSAPGPDKRFVVQKHDASRLHYDFRLEIGSVLVSWAVPKGPSMDPAQKRLALRVEDHPLEYRDFEGVIPENEYGAGAVMLWDEGTVNWFKEDMTAGGMLEKGHIEFELRGHKLKGKFALIKTHYAKSPNAWLLMKMKDGEARKDDVLEALPLSVRTGRTLEEIATGSRA